MFSFFLWRRIGARRRLRLRHAIWTAPPVGHLGLVDLVTHVVGRRETGGGPDCAIDVDHTAAGAADQMVVVIADPILEARRRAGGLNAPEKTFGDEDPEGVVHRLQRDGTDLGADGLGHGVSRNVGLARHRPQDRQSLGGHLNPALPKEISRINGHTGMVSNNGFTPRYECPLKRGATSGRAGA